VGAHQSVGQSIRFIRRHRCWSIPSTNRQSRSAARGG
jgi:hypothetical protein